MLGLPSTSVLLLELKHHNWTQHPCRFKQLDLCTLQQSLLFNSTFITRDYISPTSFSFRIHVMHLPTLSLNLLFSLTACFPREKWLCPWDEGVSHIPCYIWLNKKKKKFSEPFSWIIYTIPVPLTHSADCLLPHQLLHLGSQQRKAE